MKIPKNVKIIIEELNKNNHKAYIVGGSVRDFIMNHPVSDFDIATSASPEQVSDIFKKTIDTGSKFGTMTVVIDKEAYEVTTFRIDGEYKDNRKPDSVNFTTDILEDLSRRDFTINALAYHPNSGFIDPFGGQLDIQKKIVQAVGTANHRFNEDALRMLRAIRFATKLNFSIEKNTYKAIFDNIELMQNISIERIREELVKTFLSDFLSNSIYINHTNVLKYVCKDFYNYLQINLNEVIPFIEKAPKDTIIRWAILLHKHSNTKKLLRFLKFSKDEIKQISQLVEQNQLQFLPEKYNIKQLILKLDYVGFEKFLTLKKSFNIDTSHIENLYKDIKNEPIFLNQLDITGDILYQHGIKKDKSMGIIINQLHQMVLKDPTLNKEKSLIEIAKNINRS